jgi:hypothetical protein
MKEPPLKLQKALKTGRVPEERFRALRHGEKWPDAVTD